MKFIILIINIIFSSSLVSAADNLPSTYKGYLEVNKQVFERVLLKHDNQTELGILIQSFFEDPSSVLRLLGFYKEGVSDGTLINGAPNSMSLLVYYMLFDRLAKKIANCSMPNDPIFTADFQPTFLTIHQSICSAPTTKLTSDQYQNFWIQVHGYSAPEKEFLAWKEYHMATDFIDNAEQLYSMSLSLFMNPYFVIKN